MSAVILEQLSVGGFQVFSETARFDLAPITLLYGPNSAGKSGIEDALRFIAEVFGLTSTFGGKSHPSNRVIPRVPARERFAQLRPDWRIDDAGDRSPQLEISVCFKADYRHYRDSLVGRLGIERSDTPQGEQESLASIQVDITLTRDRLDSPDPPLLLTEGMRYAVHTNGDLLLSGETSGAVRINLASDFLFATGVDLPECKALAAARPDIASVSGSVVEIADLGYGLACSDPEPVIDAEYFYNFFLFVADNPEALPPVYPAFAEMARVFNTITKELVIRLIQDFANHAAFVPASRKVPDDEGLTFVVGSTNLSGLVPRSDPAFRELAGSLASKVAWREFYPNSDEPKACHLVNRVNDSLMGPLFRERGYRLDADFNVLLDPEGYKHLIADDNVEPAATQPDMVLTIRLRDAHDRALSLIDVGSGIGYSLPVLNSVWSKPLSLLQQPELHLHPALQSAMADILIEAASEGHRVIVETHSEHLLLRILRRIRDSSRATPMQKERRLIPADVAVYYFDPQPDGSTKVTRLRISPEGEFLDRWPRGFFTERDQDVFDE